MRFKIDFFSHCVPVLAMVLAWSFAVEAQAEEDWGNLEMRPYIGGSISFADIDYSSENQYESFLASEFRGFNLAAGLRLHRYFSVELGAFKFLEEGKDFQAMVLSNMISGTAETEFSGYYADLIGHLPLSVLTEEDSGLEFLGSLGIGKVEAKWSHNANLPRGAIPVLGRDNEDDDTAVRYGVGLEYHISDRFSTKAMVRYINIDFDDGVDSAQVVEVGVNYKF